MFVEVLILSSVLIYLIYRYGTNTHDYWKKQGVLQFRPIPFLGNLPIPGYHDQNNAEYMRNYYFKFYDSDYFGFYVLKRPALMVKSPELIKKILVKDFDHFDNRTISSGDHDPFGKYNIFSVDQPMWSFIRKQFSPAFTLAKLKTFQEVMREKSVGFLKQVEKDGNFSVKDLCERYAIDVVTSSSFGINAQTLENPDVYLRKLVKKMMDMTPVARKFEVVISFYVPELSSIFKTYLFSTEANNHFSKVFKEAEATRKNVPDKPECLLDVLSKIRGEKGITDEVVTGQGMVFLFAAVETSALTLTLLMLELAHKKDCQDRLFNEITEVFAKHGNLSYDAVKELTYLEQCLNETMRKYPVLPVLDRKCTHDYKIDDKVTIKTGTTVMINIAGLHHDPKYFPNPNVWDPERFGPNNTITPFTFLPLGDGPRNCIGARYGVTSMKTLMAHILKSYELKPNPDTPHPDNLKFVPNNLFQHPICDVHIQFIKRS